MNVIFNNPLRSREDFIAAFMQLVDPLRSHYSPGHARLHLGATGASYSREIAGMEAFSRVLWGLAPLLAGGGQDQLENVYIDGLVNGTNPEHEEYWGAINDYDQRMVEMAAIGTALCLAPERIWEPLPSEDKSRLAAWLGQINQHQLYGCNWLFFLVLVNLGLKHVGMPYDKARLDECLEELDSYYLSDGWYSDGADGHSDYYVPFAFHFYGLLYAKFMESEDPVRSERYKHRACVFAKDFVYWFADNGSALPYGRSLSYRFAQSAFWSAAAFAGIEPFSMGVIKGLLLRNLRWWFKQPIFGRDGIMSIGYAYPNLIMAENYNAPGSPYWAMKSFLPLALEENHPFWKAEELPLPDLNSVSVQHPAHLVLCRAEQGGHVLAFNPGHKGTNEHTHTSAKYEKFVYSNVFGFSVPRAEWGLKQGAFDGMLALSEGDQLYRVKRTCEEARIDEKAVYMKWSPWRDVTVRTWLIVGAPWHVRIHHIDSGRRLDASDGGFALGLEKPGAAATGIQTREDLMRKLAITDWGSSGTVLLYGAEARVELIFPHSNTNLLYPRTVIPTVSTVCAPGQSLLISAFYGESGGAGKQANHWSIPPCAEVDGNKVYIYSADGSLWYRLEL
jgi:hypothetical protein